MRVPLVYAAVLTTVIIAALGARPLAAAEPCQADEDGVQVCGSGGHAVRIFPDTVSPSKALAFGFRGRKGEAVSNLPDRSEVEDVLVRLTDGQVLAVLGGEFWRNKGSRANRMDEIAVWSPDSRAVIEVANERWDTYSLRHYVLGGKAEPAMIDLRKIVEPALHALQKRRNRKHDPAHFSFRVVEDRPVKLDNRGRARFTAMLFLPKADPVLAAEVTLELPTNSKRRGAARIVSLRRVVLN